MFAFEFSRKVFAVLSVCALLIGAARVAVAETASEEQSAAEQWTAIPTGIADAATKAAYITNAADCIEAIDLSNGQTLWENKQVHRAVALAGGKLAAIEPHGPQEPANTMGVAILDASNGHIITNSQPIVLPDWIAVEGGIGLGFSSHADIEGNTLKIYWHAWRQYVGGNPPSEDARAAARKDETGTADVNMESGRVEVHLGEIPKPIKQANSRGRFTDVGDTRLRVTEREEKVTGGVQLIRRTLEASDKRTGKPLWHHEIASDLIVPNNLPEQAQQQARQQQMQYDSRR